MSQSTRTLFIGFVVGFLFGLVLIGVIRPRGIRPSDRVIAKFGGVELKENELRERIAEQLAPAENEEYRSLQAGAQDWINTGLLEKEAKARGVDIKEIYKDVWNRVHVGYEDMLQVYKQNKESYGNQPFEQASGLIASQLRTIKYGEAKKAYVQELHKKYHAEIFLEKPKILIEGSALPIQLKIGESAAVQVEGDKIQPEAPSVKTGAAPEVGVGAKGAPAKGSPSAPIKMVEFADFHCHFCRKVAATLEKVVQNYPDKVQLIFRHYPLSPSPGSESFLTHEASACANEQGKFWEFYDEIYKTESSPKPDDLEGLASNVGLDMGKYKECMQSHRYQSAIQNDIAAGKAKGVQGTPTIFVNEETVNGAYPYEYFVDLVNNILTPGKVKPTQKPAQPSPAAEGPVQFNNDDLKGRPSIGPDNAPITIVEFSDFHCPFCKRVGPTLEQVMKNYKGKVRRVWRHYPLPMHAGADRTHQASECAHEQGKFWQYHDKIFETQGPKHDQLLTEISKQVGLDQKKFEKCLSQGKYKNLIQQEIAEGSKVGVRGTPTLFVNGQRLPGAVPYESFDSIIKSELAKKS